MRIRLLALFVRDALRWSQLINEQNVMQIGNIQLTRRDVSQFPNNLLEMYSTALAERRLEQEDIYSREGSE